MNEKEWWFMGQEKAEWPEGEFQHEPDKTQFTDEATGLVCLTKRNHMGVWCGYVGVNEGHPLFGKDAMGSYLEVHGGITFGGSFCDGEEETGICHVPEEGQTDRVWWIGFDCGHAFDITPSFTGGWTVADAVYRNLAYVQQECRDLARQLKATEAENKP